jgi:hypothetical protein
MSTKARLQAMFEASSIRQIVGSDISSPESRHDASALSHHQKPCDGSIQVRRKGFRDWRFREKIEAVKAACIAMQFNRHARLTEPPRIIQTLVEKEVEPAGRDIGGRQVR